MLDFAKISRNWLLKLLSLIIGASLWYFVVGEDRVDLIVNIPLELRNLPTNLVIANQYKRDIEVAINGPRRIIQEMRQQNISLPIDLSKAQPGAMVIQNKADSIPLPQGITVQRVQPAAITLLVDRLIQKNFTIEPVTKGSLPGGLSLKKLTLHPSHITVTGPQSLMDKVQQLKTSPIHLDKLESTTTMQVHLDLNEALVKLIGETVVEVTADVQEPMVVETIHNVPIRKPAHALYVLNPTMVTVEAEIPKQVAKETPKLALLLRATLKPTHDAAASEVEVVVTGINLPGHSPIIIHSVSPDKVHLTK